MRNKEQFIKDFELVATPEIVKEVDPVEDAAHTMHQTGGTIYQLIAALVTEVSNNNTAAAPPANVWHSRSGTAKVTAVKGINLRGTLSGDTTIPTGLGVLALLGRGQPVKYDRVLVQRNGHAFVRQPRSGGYGWLAIGPKKMEK